MKEDFLHYVWKFQKFDARELTTIQGEFIEVINPGQHNLSSGPDFFNAQLSIDDQLWAGNVEIHVRSSHWYEHHHEKDDKYDNVILHIVWEHDTEVYRKDNTPVPALQLKEIVNKASLEAYENLFSKKHIWINCENDLPKIDPFILSNWKERLYVERLQQKAEVILQELNITNNHWEAILFRMLSKNFGLKINGDAFLSIAKSLDFSVIRKISCDLLELEAVLFGQAGMLDKDKEDHYFIKLQRTYAYTKYKFELDSKAVVDPKFFRLRPSNFPTIRLSQLSVLYHTRQNLFSEIISATTPDQLYTLFDISASTYWDTHYNFDLASAKRKKRLTKKFIDLILINTVIPIKFCYALHTGTTISEDLLQLASVLPSEENSIIEKFDQILPASKNALESQALLQHKNNYCGANRCLDCAIGNSIIKG